MERQLVVFTLAHEHYGVDIAAVESIIKLQPITVVPRAPAFIEGVTNLRGSVLPVMDLRKRFGLGSTAETAEKEQKDRRIVVVALEGVKVGMIVDAVTEGRRRRHRAAPADGDQRGYRLHHRHRQGGRRRARRSRAGSAPDHPARFGASPFAG